MPRSTGHDAGPCCEACSPDCSAANPGRVSTGVHTNPDCACASRASDPQHSQKRPYRASNESRRQKGGCHEAGWKADCYADRAICGRGRAADDEGAMPCRKCQLDYRRLAQPVVLMSPDGFKATPRERPSDFAPQRSWKNGWTREGILRRVRHDLAAAHGRASSF